MNLLPKSHQEFSQKDYWDSFFKKRGGEAFEWYGEYPELAGYLHKYVKQQDNILITGCGNSSLGRDLYDMGYNKITNIDVSQVVIRQMLSQNEKPRDNLKYIQMDALDMSFKDESFSVVIDKGTLDALMPDESPDTIKNIIKYFNEIQRVLKLTGRYICISLLQEHILKALLNYFPMNNSMFRIVRCFEAETKVAENGGNSMPVFIAICTKFKSLPKKILELNLGASDKMQRFETNEDIISQIKSAQQADFVCSNLRRSKIGEDEVSLDLHDARSNKPRFTVYVVEAKPNSKNMQYAAFIVPQGREAEWLFSTKPGRQHLATVTKTNRLAIITLHRGQSYGNFDEVQMELGEVVCSLAPTALKNKKIPFLSLGSDVGRRTVKFEGHSTFSGDYVVEDVEIDEQKFRRLYYLSSQLVIQSESKMKTIKTKKGPKEIIDFTHLPCRHHVYMSAATHLACSGKKDGRVLVIGLGGGGLCSFLRKFLPQINITAVDIDPDMVKVATEWFGLVQDKQLKIEVNDGVKYLNEKAENNQKLDVVLFDVDSKDSSIGMSCPPKQFLENQVLCDVARIIDEKGFFILNLVLRDSKMRPRIVDDLQKKFKTIISYRLAEDLNEIIICSLQELSDGETKSQLQQASQNINNFFKKNRSNIENNIEIEEFLKDLKIL